MTSSKGAEVRLQVLITAAILLSMLLLSTVLVGKSYLDKRALLLTDTIESAERLAHDVDSRISHLVSPLESALRVLAHDPFTTARNQRSRLQRLPVLVDILRTYPNVVAVYAGDPDARVVRVRAASADIRRRLHVPERAAFVVDTRDEPLAKGDMLFFDEQLQLLETQKGVEDQGIPLPRSWYQRTAQSRAVQLSAPYLLPNVDELGVTLALRSADGASVVALDASIDGLSAQLAGIAGKPGTQLAIIDYADLVVAFADRYWGLKLTDSGVRQASVQELDSPAIERLAYRDQLAGELQTLDIGDNRYFGVWIPLSSFPDASLKLLMAFPEQGVLAEAKAQSLQQVYWTLAVIFILVLLGALAGRLVSLPLRQLAREMRAVANFDFTRPVRVNSRIKELNALGRVFASMSRTIHHFQRMSLTLSREPDLDYMLNGVVRHLKDSLAATSAVLYLFEDEQASLRLVAMSGLPDAPTTLRHDRKDVEHMKQLVLKAFTEDRHSDVLMTALMGRKNQLLGILALDLPHEADVSMELVQRAVDELSGSAATAIETRQLIRRQRLLLDAMIRLLADAIDAKSPYTSGHCERVPELAQMLIEAAESSDKPPFSDFAMTEAERDEFRIAAWLHDCGKITSPEYVVDKATKLETIYNRIHEIRTRFEVIWRDAEIAYLQGMLEGRPPVELQRALAEKQKQLQDDFGFIAAANIGAEFGGAENRARLEQIGKQTWTRHFDRRLGLSREEYERLPASVHLEELPVIERLLDDRPDHLVEWGDRRPPVERDNPNNRWGFDMELPEYSFNLGELYNLSINAGTLTREERFHINDHIVQTICMLSNLPLPPELKRVPEIAGNHHERMDGKGYPRRLKIGERSIPERVMAVADIFEALTAWDRPYKKAKTLSESLCIMARMASNQHLDVDIFELFLESRIYLTYAKRFLRAGQIDEANVDRRQLMLLARRDEDGRKQPIGDKTPA
ncbi:HD domain-containing protein [Marinobacterium sp. D7]|uniref:HD domain-containing phosphohydrolase n=1 Tax=Marinobacterium ramblicola TaxID=2849041 RepID=UPI001C2DA5F9|nr:HD domain-containing phosphohydrolase [Marinobacterium ramblicola]MBV1788439.1 HD domain-containing protein [Marinobacterium ramblicola]